MKNVIFIMSIMVFTLSSIACKTKQKQAEAAKISIITPNLSNTVDTENKLVDKNWKLIELFGNQVVLRENAPEPRITFNAENKFSGNAGCNRIAGSYQIREKSDSIRFSQVVATKMMCINGMETENKFLQALDETRTYIIQNDTLIFYAPQKASLKPLARFVIQ